VSIRSLSRRRTRIVFVIDTLVAGGAERHLLRLIGHLVGTERYAVSVYCLHRTGQLLTSVERLGVSVEGLPALWTPSPRSVFRTVEHLRAHLHRERPDLAHCYLVHGGLAGSVAARLAAVPRVITTRRLVHAYTGGHLLEYRVAAALMDRCSDAIIAVCEAARQQAIREGTDPAKIVTIHNSVAVPERPLSPQQQRDGGPIFGCVAELHPRKGLLHLLQAVPVVLATLPHARFVLVGTGGQETVLRSTAARLGVGGSVNFLGERLDVAALLPTFDVFVLPSLQEGLPNAILEAMAVGLPVVATRTGGVPEVVEDGVTGILIPPGDERALAAALIRVGTDERLRAAHGQRGREVALTRFSIDAEMQSVESVYDRLLRR
jgi:glycosyltransferase involved in cell wall biosynthesis